MHKLVNHKFGVPGESFFELIPARNRRGYPWMFEKPHARMDLRASTFSVGSGNPWNTLPLYVGVADSLTSFKVKMDGIWLSLDPYILPR